MFWLRVGMVNTPDGWVFGTSCYGMHCFELFQAMHVVCCGVNTVFRCLFLKFNFARFC